jgi:hypothetical protein
MTVRNAEGDIVALIGGGEPPRHIPVVKCAMRRHRARSRRRRRVQRLQAAESGDDGDYDAEHDFTESLCACYRAVRERVARGGLPWSPPRCRYRCCSEAPS